MSDAPPKPYHRWRSNEDADFNVQGDYCLACGVKRWPRDPKQSAIAEGPCQKGEPIPCGRCGDRIRWNGEKWTTVDAPVEPCLPGLGYDHQPATEGPEKWVPEAIAEQEAYLTSLERCEARVQIGAVERDCNRPITNGRCDRAHAHIEETS